MIAVIAAAGNGKRMNSQIPKPLTRLPNGKTFLDHLIEKLDGLVDKIVVVTNSKIFEHPSFTTDTRCVYRFQEQATGMGDAVFCASDLIANEQNIVIVWCDQIGLTRKTLKESIAIHLNRKSDSHITLPLLTKNSQYIHIEHSMSKISDILQAKEGDLVPTPSVNDVGLFIISSGENMLEKWKNGGRSYSQGPISNEYNFLPFLKFLSINGWELDTVQAVDNDGIGVNTASELAVTNSRSEE